jgi:hypothetical protein
MSTRSLPSDFARLQRPITDNATDNIADDNTDDNNDNTINPGKNAANSACMHATTRIPLPYHCNNLKDGTMCNGGPCRHDGRCFGGICCIGESAPDGLLCFSEIMFTFGVCYRGNCENEWSTTALPQSMSSSSIDMTPCDCSSSALPSSGIFAALISAAFVGGAVTGVVVMILMVRWISRRRANLMLSTNSTWPFNYSAHHCANTQASMADVILDHRDVVDLHCVHA